jgi:hypothetical protein
MEKSTILNKLLPKILPMTKLLLLTKTVAVNDVNNSGKEVVAAKRIPPKSAPERLVFLSSKSTNVDNLIDNHTTMVATIK